MPTSFNHQLDTLLERFNFHFTKSQIKQVVAVTSRSRDALIDDLMTVVVGNQALQAKLNELGLLALQLDTRQVQVLSVTNPQIYNALNRFFGNVQLTNEALITDAFPFPIEDKRKLDSLRTGVPYPVLSDTLTIGSDSFNRLVVCTLVDKEVEEPIPTTYLSQTGQQQLTADTTYIMKRRSRSQLFHVIYWSPILSRLILSADRNVLSLTMAQDQLHLLKHLLMTHGVDASGTMNLFGAIEPLYNSADGFVTKVGHVTTDGNPVRIPLKGQQKCLKEDHYHQAGEHGGHVHAKFAVSKKWEFVIPDTTRTIDIEVGLMGKPSMLDTMQPLTDFSLVKSKRIEDFYFAINKVLSHVPTP